jgi:uracil-DNA glycosylase family 4
VDLRPDLGAGALDAPLVIVARDFGEHEAAAGQPLCGPAGGIANRALAAAGFDVRWERSGKRTYLDPRVRLDNLVPVRPPGNDFGRHRPEDVAWGEQRLAALLERHRPKLIVAMGGEAAAFLVGEGWPADEGIQALRGYLWDTRFGRVLTTVHPAGVLREWTPWRALLDLDLRKASRELAAGCPALPTRDVRVVTRPEHLDELHTAMVEAGLAGGVDGRSRPGGPSSDVNCIAPTGGVHWLAVDIENYDVARPDPLACVGFAPTPSAAWVVPAAPGWQMNAIRALCESAVPKVLQNGQYDRFFLRWFCGIELRAQAFDTMLGWHALQPELAGKKTQGARKVANRRTVKSLAFLASVLTREPWWKMYDFASEDERYRLCGKDCCVTHEIAGELARALEVAA